MLYSIPYRKDPAGSKSFSLQKLQTRKGVRGGFSGLNKCLSENTFIFPFSIPYEGSIPLRGPILAP